MLYMLFFYFVFVCLVQLSTTTCDVSSTCAVETTNLFTCEGGLCLIAPYSSISDCPCPCIQLNFSCPNVDNIIVMFTSLECKGAWHSNQKTIILSEDISEMTINATMITGSSESIQVWCSAHHEGTHSVDFKFHGPKVRNILSCPSRPSCNIPVSRNVTITMDLKKRSVNPSLSSLLAQLQYSTSTAVADTGTRLRQNPSISVPQTASPSVESTETTETGGGKYYYHIWIIGVLLAIIAFFIFIFVVLYCVHKGKTKSVTLNFSGNTSELELK